MVWWLVWRVKQDIRRRIEVCFSPDVILCGWLGSKYQRTNFHHCKYQNSSIVWHLCKRPSQSLDTTLPLTPPPHLSFDVCVKGLYNRWTPPFNPTRPLKPWFPHLAPSETRQCPTVKSKSVRFLSNRTFCSTAVRQCLIMDRGLI